MVGRYSWAAIILWNDYEIISDELTRAEIKSLQADVDESRNIFKNF